MEAGFSVANVFIYGTRTVASKIAIVLERDAENLMVKPLLMKPSGTDHRGLEL